MPDVTRAELDFDHNSAPFTGASADRAIAWSQIRDRCPVGWNAAYGGFWVLSDFASVDQASRDSDSFMHKYEPGASDGIDYIGQLGIPRNELPVLGIGESDGDYHRSLRRTLNPLFSQRAISVHRPMMIATARWFLDQKVESGSIDLVNDFASPVTAVLTLVALGLPVLRWSDYADVFHSSQGYAPESPEWKRALYQRAPELMDELLDTAKSRRRDPRDDIVSALACLRVEEDRELTDRELVDVLWNLVGGGVDTTTAVVARAFIHLYRNPDDRQALIDDPTRIPLAVEEFIRFYPSVQALTRTVARDTVVGGQELRRGDRALLVHVTANRDSAEFDRPDEIDLARSPNRHLSFGRGAHRCIGLHLARTILAVMIEEALVRLPSYVILEDQVVEYSGFPETIGIHALPTTFTPSAPARVPVPRGLG
jgi:cytochrome P450